MSTGQDKDIVLYASALFSIAVVLFLAVSTVREDADRWLEGPQIQALRRRLQAHPNDAALKREIRRRDEALRRRFFLYRRRRVIGGWLLLAGSLCFLWAWRRRESRRPPPRPRLPPRPDKAAEIYRKNRRAALSAVAAGAGLLLLAGVGLGGYAWVRLGRSGVRRRPAGPPESAWGRPAWSRAWPQFRGPTGMGLAPASGPWPRRWNLAAGQNLAWKVPAPPLPGNSSPVVWNRKLFLTGADKTRQAVYCYDAKTGTLLWTTPISPPRRNPQAFQKLEVMEDTGYAAPTPATDGARLYVTFATADIAALDFNGKVLWNWNAGPPDSAYGLASSLVVYDKLVLWQLDQGDDAKSGKSALYGIDGSTGKVVWRTPRPVPNSWSTPIVLSTPRGPRVVACGSPFVIAYDPRDGHELWRAKVLDGDVAPMPVAAGDRVFVTQAGAQAACIRLGGRGDVTKTHVAWTSYDGLSDTPSPITDGRFFIVPSSDGTVSCLDAATGKLLWEHGFDSGFQASPVATGTLIYLFSEDGTVFLIEFGPKFVLRGTLRIGEPVRATPAFAGGRIYVRTAKHLLCIRSGPAGSPP